MIGRLRRLRAALLDLIAVAPEDRPSALACPPDLQGTADDLDDHERELAGIPDLATTGQVKASRARRLGPRSPPKC
jgi:hypothetical protein